MKKAINALLAVCLLAGCGNGDALKDPVAYAENMDHGLRKQVNRGALQYVLQYKTPAYILDMERAGGLEPDSGRLAALKGMIWFNVSFSVPGFPQSPLRYQVSDVGMYNDRLNYYLNEAGRDMRLLYGKDTLYPASYWFEHGQNLAAHETIVVGFRLPDGEEEPERDIQFSFYDRVFKNGIIKMQIRATDLEHIPSI